MSLTIVKRKPDKKPFRIPSSALKSFIERSEISVQYNEEVKCIAVCNYDKPPDIFKLNVDCCHEIFDWLSQRDIIAIGRTCKRFQRIAGNFFRENYGVKVARAENDGIYVLSQRSNVFSQFIRSISISGDRLRAYQFVGANCGNATKSIRLYGVLPEDGFKYIKNVLNSVEVLEMNECIIKGEFYEDYLKYCPNIRDLSVSRSERNKDKSIVIGNGNDWLLQKYPKLEHFELIDGCDLKNNELVTFLALNPSVRTFSTDSRSLWEARDSFLGSNIKLERLAIDVGQSKIIDSKNQTIVFGDSLYELLKQLHQQGVYKRLSLYLDFVSQIHLQNMFLLKSLEMVCGDILQFNDPMPNLKTLGVCYGDEIMNIERLPSITPNLERIYMARVSFNTLVPFICHSAKLKQIKLKGLNDINGFESINLAKLNMEREKLVGARKLMIFLKEDEYLALKWSKHNLTFSLLEIRRFESFEWEELNARSRYKKSM